MHQSNLGSAMFLFFALPIPICWPNSKPGDESPSQPKPEDEVSDKQQRDTTERPRNKSMKTANEKLSHVICGFIDRVMTWSVSILMIPLQKLPCCYSLGLVYRISASSVSENSSSLH
jgi:hypothetical protein